MTDRGHFIDSKPELPRSVTRLVAILFVLFVPHTLPAHTHGDWRDGPWKKQGKEHGVHMSKHTDSPIDVRAFRAEMYLDFQAHQAFAVASDHDWARRPSFVREYRILSETSAERVVYQRIKYKGLGERELTARYTVSQPASRNSGEYVLAWTLANDAGPDKPKVKHAKFWEGSIVLKPIEAGKRTKATIVMTIDPRSWIPDFVLSKANRKLVLELARRLRRELRARH